MCGTSRERINKRPSVHRFHLYFPHGCGTLYSPQVFGGADGEEVFLWPIPSKSWLKTAKPTTTTSLRINTKPGSNWQAPSQVHPSGPCEPEGFLLRRQGRRDVRDRDAHQPYEKGNIFNKDPMRQRRLLMHKRRSCGCCPHQAGRLLPDPSVHLLPAPGQAGAGWQRAKSSMTSVTPPQRGTPSGRWTGLSRAETDDPSVGIRKDMIQ